MFSLFFIERPRFAFVISILITLAGLIAIQSLPVAQYPEITPPQVTVSASYPGASADVVESTIASVVEAEINGVEGMSYMSSSSSQSSYSLTITFELGTDAELAAVDVQNRIALATPQLPQVVVDQGVSVAKQSSNMLLVYGLSSPNQTYDELFLSNYASINIVDNLARVAGVGKVSSFGAGDYGMRIWLDPQRLANLGLTSDDVSTAIREQNIQAAAGQVGQPPAAAEQQFQYTVTAKGRLQDVEEFENIVLRAEADGAILRLGDVARIELGSQSYATAARLNGKPTAMFAVYQLPDANALEVAAGVAAELERLAERFPDDMAYTLVKDGTSFIEASLQELVVTLFIALALVILVVYVFLQDWRATLIPALAIPVSLIGTFAVFSALGFSINTITLFGLILAIGLVVDDAIVVIENTQRHIEDGLQPKEATRAAMQEVVAPIIATTLVLLAVFVPVALTPGIAGRLYQQFALTIAVAVAISSLNALTLSPALCATLLRSSASGERAAPFRWFNSAFERIGNAYVGAATVMVRRLSLTFVLFLFFAAAALGLFSIVPGGFLPEEDQGVVFINFQLPNGASLGRTDRIVTHAEQTIAELPGVADIISVRGFSLLGGSGANAAMAIVALQPWDQRSNRQTSAQAIVGRLWRELGTIPGATIIAFTPPAISGLGSTGGFEMMVQDRSGSTPQELAAASRALIYAANQHPQIDKAYTTFSADVPQVYLDIDRETAQTLGVSVSSIFSTLQANLGSSIVNDFNKYGRNYKVMLQADTAFRDNPDDIGALFVRSAEGDMVPLSALSSVSSALGPELLTRYNMFRSAKVNGSGTPGVSSGAALAAMEATALETLPAGMSYEWSSASLQEKEASSIGLILALSLVVVFLFLVAQYESWILPLAVLLVVPVAIVGALATGMLRGLGMDLYVQIGLILLAGLATKQAILIVEFAKDRREKTGRPIAEVAAEAARLRFRAVIMTAFSFILGIMPLLVATGAGAGARISLGTVVFGGMLATATIGTLMVPGFYALFQNLDERLRGKDKSLFVRQIPDSREPG
ncbi:MAG: efflux RND transporter permease subunit [Pseudomonadales bacterium]